MKVGDKVTRMLAGTMPMELKVTEIDDEFIHCGPWKFDKDNGAEIDEECGWTKERTGSFLREICKSKVVLGRLT